jgi:hypothetical protein
MADIHAIALAAGAPERLVRYVLDQGMLGGVRGRVIKGRAGRPRDFTPLEAFAVAAAAAALHGGVSRPAVTDAMAWLARSPWPPPGAVAPPRPAPARVVGPPRSPLEALFLAAGPATLRIADAALFRVVLAGYDSGWREPRSSAPAAASFKPRVAIELDVAPVARCLGPHARPPATGHPGAARPGVPGRRGARDAGGRP